MIFGLSPDGNDSNIRVSQTKYWHNVYQLQNLIEDCCARVAIPARFDFGRAPDRTSTCPTDMKAIMPFASGLLWVDATCDGQWGLCYLGGLVGLAEQDEIQGCARRNSGRDAPQKRIFTSTAALLTAKTGLAQALTPDESGEESDMKHAS